MLITNVASRCGYTSSNYKALQDLYAAKADKGLEILAFPCNQFGAQEPGTAEQIKSFCQASFGVKFPLMEKVDVNGPGTSAVYKWLKANTSEADIKWNFATKFIVSRDGAVTRIDDGQVASSAAKIDSLL